MRRFEIFDQYSSPFFFSESCTFFNPFFTSPILYHDDLTCTALDLTESQTCPRILSLLDFPSPFDPPRCDVMFCGYDQVLRRHFRSSEPCLHDRVAELESRFDRFAGVDRKYKWTAEIKGAVDRKYKLKAEIEGGRGKREERKFKFTSEIKSKDDQKRMFTWEATIDAEKKKKKGYCVTRSLKIEEPDGYKTLGLRQGVAKRGLAAKDKGKKKELSPQDAAAMIQMSYRSYRACRSETLHHLRELALARTKLKELRHLFHNFSYRAQIARDAEERQRFSEKIIVLLLTVDTIKGGDHMVKAAKRSMVNEMELMLEWVDPHPGGRILPMKKSTLDMPSGSIQTEVADSLAQLAELVDQ